MKQIVLEAPGRFTEREGSTPDRDRRTYISPYQRVGVCASDLHAFAGRHPMYTYPQIIGQELSGVVKECPINESEIRAGDSCAIEPYMT